MYPPGPFAVPYPSFQQPVTPPTVDPFEGPLRYIPINCQWLPYIAGALTQLLLQATWDTGDDVDALLKVQGQVTDLISKISCIEIPTISELCGSQGSEGDCDMGCCLRWQDGVLQQLNCGVWEAVAGLPGGVFQPPQPGNGSPQPQPGGGCQSYRMLVPARGSALIPTVVNTGDQLTTSSALGSTTDVGGIGRWNCPDGDLFLAGVCIDGTTALDGSAYAPTVPYGRLLYLIDGVYYDAIGAFTVPSGVANQQVALVVNYAPGGNYDGSISVFVEVCNNQAETWAHTLDLSLNPYGFVTLGDGGQWVAGQGLQSTNVIQMPNNGNQLDMKLDFGSAINFTDIRFLFNTVLGSHGGTRYQEFGYLDGGGTYHQLAIQNAPSTGSAQSLEYATPVSANGLQLVGVLDANPNPGATDGDWTIYQLFVAGNGPDPFV